MKKYKNKKWLKHQYKNKGKSTLEVAQLAGVVSSTILYWLDKNNISTRKPQETRRFNKETKYKDKKWLEQNYIQEQKTMREMADKANCNRATIYDWLKEYDIPTRNRATAIEKKVEVECAQCGEEDRIPKSHAERKEHHFCSKKCMAKWYSENLKKKNSPRWKGGGGEYQEKLVDAQGIWSRNRKRALQRDDSKCQLCYAEEDLQVHHIKPVRFGGSNYIGNLITLCRSCHAKVENGS